MINVKWAQKKIFRPGGRGLYAGYTPVIVVFRLEPSDSTAV